MRPSRGRDGAETLPADPSCDRELGLQLEVASFFYAPPDQATLQGALGDERGAALGTRLGDRPLPHHELAVRVRRAAEERPPAARSALHDLPRAARLGTGNPERHRLGGLAVRVAGARDELPEAAVLDDHRLAAGRADLVGGLVLGARAAVDVSGVLALRVGGTGHELAEAAALLQQLAAALRALLPGRLADLLAGHLPLGPGEVTLERLVELPHRVDPLALALLDLVEVVFHLGGELDVHDVLEVRDELVGDGHAELGRGQRAPLAVHVAAIVDDRAEDRGVRRGPPDPELLERLDERSLREAWRRLGEVLLGVEAEQR